MLIKFKKLQGLREEIDSLNATNEREIARIRKIMNKEKTKTKVVTKRMVLNEAFQMEIQEIKVQKK